MQDTPNTIVIRNAGWRVFPYLIVALLIGAVSLRMARLGFSAYSNQPGTGVFLLVCAVPLAAASFALAISHIKAGLLPATLTISADGVAYQAGNRHRQWAWDEIQDLQLNSNRVSTWITFKGAYSREQQSLPGRWAISGSKLLDILKAGKNRHDCLQQGITPAPAVPTKGGSSLIAALAAAPSLLFMIGGGILIIYQENQRATLEKLQFALPAYVRPAGCLWTSGSPHNINIFCRYGPNNLDADNIFARYGLDPPGKGHIYNWVRVGNDAAMVDCNPKTYVCYINKYINRKFYQPPPADVDLVRHAPPTTPGHPLHIGQIRAAYTDLY